MRLESIRRGICVDETDDIDDPVAYVISLNLRRRHLDESQRAMVAAKLATLKLGDNKHSEGPSIEEASRLLNVGHASVERAKIVQRTGAPELLHAVEEAADVATLPRTEQQEIVARGEREILQAAQHIRARKAEIRRAERIERLAATCNQNTPFPSNRRYAVLYADAPWQFHVYDENSSIASEHGAAGVHYPCMSTDAICALPVKKLATDAAALFLWTTAPHLPEALQVIAAWGFTYKTHAVWVKDWIGLGYFVRNQHELLLIATRGDSPIARHLSSAPRAASTAASPMKPMNLSNACIHIPTSPRSSYSPANRGTDGIVGVTKPLPNIKQSETKNGKEKSARGTDAI